MNNVDDGMICAGVDQGGESQHLMLMAMVEVERLLVAMTKLERMQSQMKVETMEKVERMQSRMKVEMMEKVEMMQSRRKSKASFGTF